MLRHTGGLPATTTPRVTLREFLWRSGIRRYSASIGTRRRPQASEGTGSVRRAPCLRQMFSQQGLMWTEAAWNRSQGGVEAVGDEGRPVVGMGSLGFDRSHGFR